jgi:hypothetical protein
MIKYFMFYNPMAPGRYVEIPYLNYLLNKYSTDVTFDESSM